MLTDELLRLRVAESPGRLATPATAPRHTGADSAHRHYDTSPESKQFSWTRQLAAAAATTTTTAAAAAAAAASTTTTTISKQATDKSHHHHGATSQAHPQRLYFWQSIRRGEFFHSIPCKRHPQWQRVCK